MSPPVFRYAAYGLRICSELTLPLLPASAGGEPDLNIRIGATPEALAAPRDGRRNWEATPDLFLLKVDGVGRYLVREGREIMVECGRDSDSGTVVPFLLGSVLAACLQQRGILTLHASAVAADGGAVLLAGNSGVGKSTLLAALVERGYTMLSDDVTGVVVGRGHRAVALPAFPYSRLWADAVEKLGWKERIRERVRARVEKYLVAVPRFQDTPLALHAVFVLTRGNRDGIEVETVPPAAAFEYLARRTYRKLFAHGLGRAPEHFRTLWALTARVPVVRVVRPTHGFQLAALADRVESCLREGGPPRARRDSRQAQGRTTARGAEPPERARQRLDGAPGKASSGSIVWLASYPRSGNTWLRALLTNYLEAGKTPASIDALAGGYSAIAREVFDEETGLSSSDLTPEELLRHRSALHELLAADLPRPSFVKVHDACLRVPGGGLLFPPAATLGAVYIVRNPLDVAVSLAHFWNWRIARAVAELNRPEAALSSPIGGISPVFPQALSTWSGHVASWLDQREIPVQVVRYEDLLADPVAAFEKVLRFAGLEPEAERLARAVEHARFDRLRAQEERSGFVEKPQTARFFFRAGRAGSWRDVLSQDQVRALTDAHGPLMERFDYLREAEAYLRGDGQEPHGSLRVEGPS